MFEIHNGSPVIGLVLDETTCGAASEFGEVEAWVHRKVEADTLS